MVRVQHDAHAVTMRTMSAGRAVILVVTALRDVVMMVRVSATIVVRVVMMIVVPVFAMVMIVRVARLVRVRFVMVVVMVGTGGIVARVATLVMTAVVVAANVAVMAAVMAAVKAAERVVVGYSVMVGDPFRRPQRSASEKKCAHVPVDVAPRTFPTEHRTTRQSSGLTRVRRVNGANGSWHRCRRSAPRRCVHSTRSSQSSRRLSESVTESNCSATKPPSQHSKLSDIRKHVSS